MAAAPVHRGRLRRREVAADGCDDRRGAQHRLCPGAAGCGDTGSRGDRREMGVAGHRLRACAPPRGPRPPCGPRLQAEAPVTPRTLTARGGAPQTSTGDPGLEPGLTDSKSAVLPLDDSPSRGLGISIPAAEVYPLSLTRANTPQHAPPRARRPIPRSQLRTSGAPAAPAGALVAAPSRTTAPLCASVSLRCLADGLRRALHASTTQAPTPPACRAAVASGAAVTPPLRRLRPPAARVAKPRDKAKVETAVQVDMAGMRTEGCLAGQEENVDAGGSERSEWALSSSSHISLPASRSVCDSGSMFRAPGPLSPHGPARSAAGRG